MMEDKDDTSQPFPFFNLPELVIEKIVKEYISLEEKVTVLSEIRAFKHLLARKRLWYDSSREFFQEIGAAVKPGWYVLHHFNIRYDGDYSPVLQHAHYLSVDYSTLSVSIYKFDFTNKQARILLLQETHERRQKHTSLERFKECASLERIASMDDLFIYECDTFSVPFYFWICKSESYVRWPESPGWSKKSKVFKLNNNKCYILDRNAHPHPLSLTFQTDCTVILKCVSRWLRCPNKVHTVITPLKIQFCNEKIRPDVEQPLECVSCEKGLNCVHPHYKETFFNIERGTVSLSETLFFNKMEEAVDFKANASS